MNPTGDRKIEGEPPRADSEPLAASTPTAPSPAPVRAVSRRSAAWVAFSVLVLCGIGCLLWLGFGSIDPWQQGSLTGTWGTDGMYCSSKNPVVACVNPTTKYLHIPEGDAAQTLRAFQVISEVLPKSPAHANPGFVSDTVSRHKTGEVEGQFSAPVALNIMLSGTGLALDSKTMTVIALPDIWAPLLVKKDGTQCYQRLPSACVNPATGHFHIPQGHAADTLSAFAMLSAVIDENDNSTFAFVGGQVAGHETQEVDGMFTAKEVLERMLQGSGVPMDAIGWNPPPTQDAKASSGAVQSQ